MREPPEGNRPPDPGTGITVDHAAAVASVTIVGAPGRPGALDVRTNTALRDALEAIAVDTEVRAVVLRGTGRTFCLGQDLGEHAAALRADATGVWEVLREHYNPIVTALATMPKPVIAAVNGAAAGAGASFAFACDLRFVAEGAAFHLAFGAIGLSVDSGMSWTLPRLVGYARAADLLLRPRPIPADQAFDLGLATEVVPAPELEARAMAVAAELAAGPTVAFGAVKQALAYSAAHNLVDSLEMEAALQTVTGTTDDHAAALRAFLEKRPPRFNGR